MPKSTHYTVVVIGTGFGGTMTALPLACELVHRKKNETILMLERGTWWTTPVGTVQDKEVKTYDFLLSKGQPVQFWSTPNNFRGFVDIFTRCLRRKKNEDGLYDFSLMGRRGLLGFLGRQNDGVNVVRACGVGGGSLVYSNITIRPPNFIFNDPRWPLTWTLTQRDGFYDLARNCIGHGVLWALNQPGQNLLPPSSGLAAGSVNTGLSNIVTRTAGLDPHWAIQPDPNNPRGLKQIQPPPNPVPPGRLDPANDLWIDRARLFQTAISQLTPEFGAVDLAINDIDPAKPDNEYGAGGVAKNYCERQGRCNVGCLPGARHTLNKQLMVAVHGSPTSPPVFQNNELEIQPLAEVDVIVARPAGGYEIRYLERDQERPWRTTARSVTADKVVVAAGCLGTNEILLRSKQRGTLPNLSDCVGFGFSTNGDYLGFIEGTKNRMRLTRGPVTTSFGHFNTGNPETGADTSKFHNVEDQGIPPALASIVGSGVPFIRKLSGSHHSRFFIVWTALRWGWKTLVHFITAFFKNFAVRQDIFETDDEILTKMLCVVAQGHEAAVGQFRLGTSGRDTPLRVKRTDGKEFWQDPIYQEIDGTLSRLAPIVAADPNQKFENPFVNLLTGELKASAIPVAHPLGGCRMAKDVTQGVVDEFGRVFDKTKAGARPFYGGLYVADASIISTALGVNPSLTISALSLRVARKIIDELADP
jgi:choline dehydrogenase-like flavoprotein